MAEEMSSVTNVFSYSIAFSGIVIGICPGFKPMTVVEQLRFFFVVKPLRKYNEPLYEYRYCCLCKEHVLRLHS